LSLIGAFHPYTVDAPYHQSRRDCKDGEDKPASESELIIKIMFRRLTVKRQFTSPSGFLSRRQNKK